jgi:hypothetical protein
MAMELMTSATPNFFGVKAECFAHLLDSISERHCFFLAGIRHKKNTKNMADEFGKVEKPNSDEFGMVEKPKSDEFGKVTKRTWIYLDLPGVTWFYLDLPGYTWIYLGLPRFTWIYLGCTGKDQYPYLKLSLKLS